MMIISKRSWPNDPQKTWRLGVVTYFYLFKYSLTFPGTAERECLEKLFDVVDNRANVEKLHNQLRERQLAKENAIKEAKSADKETKEKDDDIVFEPNSTSA